MQEKKDSLTIRSAVLADGQVLAGLFAELGFPATSETIAARLRAMQNAEDDVLVAVIDQKVIGVLTLSVMQVLHRPTPVGRLSALVITEVVRGTGVGRALVERGETLLKARGCELVEVTSNLKLEQAHAFYKRMGYEVSSYRFMKSLLDLKS